MIRAITSPAPLPLIPSLMHLIEADRHVIDGVYYAGMTQIRVSTIAVPGAPQEWTTPAYTIFFRPAGVPRASYNVDGTDIHVNYREPERPL